MVVVVDVCVGRVAVVVVMVTDCESGALAAEAWRRMQRRAAGRRSRSSEARGSRSKAK
jgi:hypothetical protein